MISSHKTGCKMPKAHQKKRNAGLLFEFLTQTISQSLVDGNKKKSSAALKILKKHFKPGTELYKEFRLISSLLKTAVSSDAVALSILQEAKAAARSRNVVELDRQKSLLIRNINHTLLDENFYDQHVPDYKKFATVQTLINDWRSKDVDIGRMAKYENQLVEWLTTKNSQTTDTQMLPEQSPGESRLLMKVMMKKLNEKYNGVLNDDQKALIRAYAFSEASGDDKLSVKKKLQETKESLLSSIDGYMQENKENRYVLDKLHKVREIIANESLEHVDDDTVTRFMQYTKLKHELVSEELDASEK